MLCHELHTPKMFNFQQTFLNSHLHHALIHNFNSHTRVRDGLLVWLHVDCSSSECPVIQRRQAPEFHGYPFCACRLDSPTSCAMAHLPPASFFRLFTGESDDVMSVIPPAPLPVPGDSYTMLGGTYAVPPVFTPPLQSLGIPQLYDESCCTRASDTPHAGPTARDELRRYGDLARWLFGQCANPTRIHTKMAHSLRVGCVQTGPGD